MDRDGNIPRLGENRGVGCVSCCSGFTLLEVLVSLILLSIMLLGLDAMNIASQRLAKSIWYGHLATLQIENMHEMLRAGEGKLSEQQFQEWEAQNSALLPRGRGMVTGLSSVSVFWGDKNQISCEKNIIAPVGCLTDSHSSKYWLR